MLNNEKSQYSGKIAVASNDGTRVTGHIGRCKLFVIFTIDDSKIVNKEIRENVFTHHRQHRHNEEHHHGEGHSHRHGHSGLIEALSDCKVLIFQSGGWRIIDDLKQNNIIPVLTNEPLAEEAALKYSKGELEIRDENVCNDH
jgi:predicted Fe-Mo cluster-binding NifX family protein